MQMTREAFHAYLGTLEHDDYIVCYKYKYLFEKEWSYQNVIYIFNGDMSYEIQGDIDEGQDEIYVIGFVPVSAIDCAALTILPLNKPESEDDG